jgi:hypothetical protein
LKGFFHQGRRRREVVVDPLTGQNVERYQGEFNEIGSVPLNETEDFYSEKFALDDDDDFDDQFDEDIMDKKLLREFFMEQRNSKEEKKEEDKNDDLDLSSSRWIAYDALGRALER